MSDVEMTKLCAEAMGLAQRNAPFGTYSLPADGSFIWVEGLEEVYDPLRDDAQAMALVKKFQLDVIRGGDNCWIVEGDHCAAEAVDRDLNRAICEAIAKMQAAKAAA